MTQPLCIDLFCGLGGWSEGFLAEGYLVVGFDIERHRYPRRALILDQDGQKSMSGKDRHGNTLMNRALEQIHGFHKAPLMGGWDEYPGQLVLQDVLTLHGSQFRNATCIVASPPCQEYSYMAMPWSRAKQIARALRENPEGPCVCPEFCDCQDYDSGLVSNHCPQHTDNPYPYEDCTAIEHANGARGRDSAFPEGYTGSRTIEQLNALFNACFRIQREASEAAGRHIPMVVENVKGAQPWVGRAKANYGSFYLWGDVAMVGNRVVCRPEFGKFTKPLRKLKGWGGTWFHNADTGRGNPNRNRTAIEPGRKVQGFNFHEHEKTGKPGRSFQSAAVDGLKTIGHVNKRDGYGHTRHLTNQRESDGVKQHLSGPAWFDQGAAAFSSKGLNRKAASAQIAKIPFDLARYIAATYKPWYNPAQNATLTAHPPQPIESVDLPSSS